MHHPQLIILLPVYDDYESLAVLIRQIDDVVGRHGISARVVIVDDGSQSEPSWPDRWEHLNDVSALLLKRNLGHQRAICVGLSYIHEHLQADAVLIMDSDGEDDPQDIPRLLEAFEADGGRSVTFAGRTKRSEGVSFRIGYAAFKVIHRILTGHRVEVGNYSIVPWRLLDRLVAVSELWNHFAASVYKSRLPRQAVPTRRGVRIAGRSKMNFVSLVTHGLSATSVFGETVGVRVLGGLALLGSLVLAAIVAAVCIRLFTSLSVPGWATYTTGLLMVILLQLAGIATMYVVLVLNNRHQMSFIPSRDYRYFCGQCVRLSRKSEPGVSA